MFISGKRKSRAHIWLFSLIALGMVPVLIFIGNTKKTKGGQSKVAENIKTFQTEQVNDIEYGKGGEKVLKLDLIQPKGKSNQVFPALIFIHGGAFSAGSKEMKNDMLELFAQKGYVCASIDYRLYPEAVWPDQLEDCKTAVRFLRANAEKYRINPERIAIWGSSAGATLAALVATTGDVARLEGSGGWKGYSSRVQAACIWFGVTDIVSQPVPKGIYKLLGGPVNEDLERAKDASAISHVTKEAPPFLIFHGDEDKGIPPIHSEVLHKALVDAGVESELQIIKGAGHGGPPFRSPEVLDKMTAFFDKYLK